MELLPLGDIGVNSTRTGDWDDFASGLLSMEKVDQNTRVCAPNLNCTWLDAAIAAQ